MRLSTLTMAPLAAATSITLYLPAVPNPFSLPPSTHATLSTLGASFSAPISSLNTFVFHNVTPGSYLADVHCKTDGFRPLRIDVADDSIQAWDTFRGNEWANKGDALPIRSNGVEVKSIGKKIYFVDRPQCTHAARPPCTAKNTANPRSLRAEHSQEPHDPNGPSQHGHLLWHAQAR